jgi:predicted Zn-dependent protease
VVVIKSNFFFITLVSIFFCKTLLSAQIYDYQTELFIEKINTKILSVNFYAKKINLKIINDNFPNAFVTENNDLFISSGLLIHSPDYISLLAVLAHEIGHIENYHITKRKSEMGDLKKIKSFGNLAIIAGSMLIKNPELINAVAFNQTAINNLYINFSQDQEKEADQYAVETLYKLNLSTESIKEFLRILENKSKFDLMDIELRKFSTHPLFKERYDILDFKKESTIEKFDKALQKEFSFIKAKFIAYTDNNYSNKLSGDEKIYYEAIKASLSGDLLKSLKKLNILISKHDNNFFLIETKADILVSFGYRKEAIKFYKIVLKNHTSNNYVKFNIFIHSDYFNENINFIKKIFLENYMLIKLFPENKILLTKFYNLSKVLEYTHWTLFFEILLFEKNNFKKALVELDNQTEDNNLKKLIKLYI